LVAFLPASFFFPFPGVNGGKCSLIPIKKYNPLYNLQSMSLEPEVDKVDAEDI